MGVDLVLYCGIYTDLDLGLPLVRFCITGKVVILSMSPSGSSASYCSLESSSFGILGDDFFGAFIFEASQP